MEKDKTFYTYLWLREDGTPYYVGKGCGNRAYQSKRRIFPRPKDKNRIIVQEFLSERDAFDAEQFLISYYGRKDIGTGILRNASNGGLGEPGHHGWRGERSPEYRHKLSVAFSGRAISQSHRENMRRAMLSRSEEEKRIAAERVASANRRRVWSKDSLKKISDHSTKDMAGLTFGGLFVLERGPNGGFAARWWCRCICGNLLLVRGVQLRRGQKSCGCLSWPEERRQQQIVSNVNRIWTEESRDKLWRNRAR